MNYMKLCFNKQINEYLAFRYSKSEFLNISVRWIYYLIKNLYGCSLINPESEWYLIKKIQDSTFTGCGLNDDLSLYRHPSNDYWYIYYAEPILNEIPTYDDQGNLLPWDDDDIIFDFLTPENSLKISQENLIELLETWTKIIYSKSLPPFMLIWQNDQEWISIETFNSEETMNDRINEIERINSHS